MENKKYKIYLSYVYGAHTLCLCRKQINSHLVEVWYEDALDNREHRSYICLFCDKIFIPNSIKFNFSFENTVSDYYHAIKNIAEDLLKQYEEYILDEKLPSHINSWVIEQEIYSKHISLYRSESEWHQKDAINRLKQSIYSILSMPLDKKVLRLCNKILKRI